MRWDLVLERQSRNRLNPDITRKKLKKIASSAERNRSLGFIGKIGKLRDPDPTIDETTKDEVYQYRVRLRIEKPNVRSKEAARTQFEHVLKVVSRCAQSEGWKIIDGDQEESTNDESLSAPIKEQKPDFIVPQLTNDAMAAYFFGIYEREEHIRTIHDAVETMIITEGKITNHQLLYGLWGSCKTLLMERFKQWYEADNPKFERVVFADGTTMTKAGLENWLLNLSDGDVFPEILVVDELEKQPVDNMAVLNGIMGSGVLAKMNARIGNKRAAVRMLVVGICNDMEALKKSSLGNALLSRFGDPLYCTRPSRELAGKILRDIILAFPDGNPEWADEALMFGWDTLGQRDIRKLRKHLSARDRLLDGSYQRDVLKMLSAQRKEEHIIKQEILQREISEQNLQNSQSINRVG